MSQQPDLQGLREEIEQIDLEILGQLKRRMDLVERIAATKLEAAYPFRDRQREELVLQRVRQAANGLGLDSHQVERLYRLIMEMSLGHQQAHLRSRARAPLRVAYQGVEGSYSHLTAQRRYAHRPGGVFLVGYGSVRDAVEGVAEGREDFALLPIENTTAGSINETYDLLAEGRATITGEVVSEIHHCLLALPGVQMAELRTIHSHPQALAQCDEFLRGMPWVRTQAEFDTAGSARKVRQSGDRTLGAIASESAAGVFGLEILRAGIESQKHNFTRFVEVGREAANVPPDSDCKTSLLLRLVDQPGCLGEILLELSRRGLSLTKLESRPVRGAPWSYRFYLDVLGHAASAAVSEALEAIALRTEELRVLGTYPRADAPAPTSPR